MNSQKSSLTKLPSAVEFWRAFRDQNRASAQLYVQIIEARPDFRQESIEMGVSKSLLDAMERVGRDQWHERLLLAIGTQYNLLRKLPMSEQEKAINDGVEVLQADNTTRTIPLDDLTPDQARQAIGKSLAQQRTWLNDHAQPKGKRTPDQIVIQKAKRQVIFHGHIITHAMLLQMLAEIG